MGPLWNGVRLFSGGDGGDRTPGLYVANVPLSHLSYIPTFSDFGLRIKKAPNASTPRFQISYLSTIAKIIDKLKIKNYNNIFNLQSGGFVG